MNYFFSIITVNLNNAVGLKKTINSVCSQSFKNFEYIIIDGGSTDGSAELLREDHSKINYWTTEKDHGIYDAMNKGIAKANGKYLLFLNSGDCFADCEVLDKVASFNCTQDLLYGNMMIVKSDGSIKYGFLPEKISLIYLYKDTIWHPVSFFKKEVFMQSGGYDTNYKIAGDYDFLLRILLKAKCSYRHLPLFISLFDNGGVSSMQQNKSVVYNERLQCQKKYFNFIILSIFRAYSFIRQ